MIIPDINNIEDFPDTSLDMEPVFVLEQCDCKVWSRVIPMVKLQRITKDESDVTWKCEVDVRWDYLYSFA